MHTIPQELRSAVLFAHANFTHENRSSTYPNRGHHRAGSADPPSKKILVPTDFSETSKKAVQYALRFAEQFGCEIALLYVVEPATPMVGAPLAVEVFTDKDEFSMAENDLAVLAAESHTNGAHSVSSFVRVGHAPNEITKAAKDLDVDLIIIATHGYTSWRHFCIGSTAERVVRTAPCPVLVVREKEHEFV